MRIKSYIKYFVKQIIRAVMYMWGLFIHVKNNRILFYSFTGRLYSCSPKYIAEYINENYKGDFEIIWAFRDLKDAEILPKEFKCVKYNSIKFYYYHLSSKVIISNITPFKLIRKKRNQVMIDTWHGGGAYKIAGEDKVDVNSQLIKKKNKEYNRKNVSAYVSSCQMFTEKEILGSFGFNGTIIKSGLPRNDIFFYSKEKQRQIKERVYQFFNIPLSYHILLYAPTWRSEGEDKRFELDVSTLKNSLKKRFGGDWKILMRTHVSETGVQNEKYQSDVINAYAYQDMQELLVASDVLISDYSSSIWDFSLTKKPCFLYTYDLEVYEDKQGFYINIEEWGIPICRTFQQLLNMIECFNELEFSKKMEKHHQMFGGYEDGHSCEHVMDYILTQIKKNC